MEGSEPTDANGGHLEGVAIIRGMSVALLGSLLGGGFGFFFLVLMARLLGQDEFGLLVLAVNLLVTVAVLSIAGADYATIYYVASADSAGRKRGAMITPLRLVIALNLSIATATAVFARPIAVHLLAEPRFTNILRALALALPLTVLAQMFSAALSGLEQARGELARKVVEQFGRIILAPLALAAGFGLVGAVLGMAAAAGASATVVGYLLLRSVPRGGQTELVASRSVITFSWPQAVANGARQLWVLANILILTHATTARTVALFGAAFAISHLPLLIYNAFAFRFSPVIARLWAQSEYAALHEMLKSVTRWVAMFALPFYAVAIALPAPLLHIYGSEYRKAAVALAIMTVATLLNSLTGPVAGLLVMSGHVKLEMTANLLAAALMVAIALALTPRYGLTGAAVSALTYTIVLNALKAYFVWRTMGTYTFSRSLLGPLTAALVASLLAVGLEEVTGIGSSLLGAVALALILVAVYALLLVRVIGISQADRHTLILALRPSR